MQSNFRRSCSQFFRCLYDVRRTSQFAISQKLAKSVVKKSCVLCRIVYVKKRDSDSDLTRLQKKHVVIVMWHGSILVVVKKDIARRTHTTQTTFSGGLDM